MTSGDLKRSTRDSNTLTVAEIDKGCYSFSSEEAVVDLERFSAISSEFHHCLHLLDRRLVSSRFTTWPYRFGYCRRRFCGAPLRYYSCGIQHFHIYNLSQHGDIHLNPGPRADVTFGLGRVDSINETTSRHVTTHPADSNGVYSSVTAPSRLRQLTGHITVDNCLI